MLYTYDFNASCYFFMRRPKIILEIWKKATYLYVIDKRVIYKFFKYFTDHRKKTNGTVVFSLKSYF